MWPNILKFMHIISVLGLLAFTLANTAFVTLPSKRLRPIYSADLICVGFITILYYTGASLVLPKGYQYATPWIHDAFALLGIATIQTGLSLYLKFMNFMKLRWLIQVNYFLQIGVLMLIVHDAVAKHTLWQ